MNEITDEDAKRLLIDPIQFKIHCAEKSLESIPDYVPLDIFPREKIMAEVSIENFLFYSVSAIDILFQEINKKMKLGLKSNQVSTSKILEKLGQFKTKESKKIEKLLMQYFQQPAHDEHEITDVEFDDAFKNSKDASHFFTEYENRNRIKYRHFWNHENSNLWMLRNQRNLITHDSLLKQAGLRGTVAPKDFLRVRLVYNNHPTKMWDSLHVENPNEYYSEAFSHLQQFIKNTQQILESKK